MPNQTIFLNETGRLRSGWRFSFFLLAFVFCAGVLAAAATAALGALPTGFANEILALMSINIAVTLTLAVALGWLAGRFLEDLPFRALGIAYTENWLKDLILGLILGAASIAIAALVAYFGGMRFEINDTSSASAIFTTLGVTLSIFIAGAAAEEALFRGYLLQTMTRARLFWIGAILTSFLFATAHNGNPNSNPLSWTNTFLAGLWLAAAYWKTRNLWFPIGIHLAWNWFQGAIFGINVSGLSTLAAAPVMRVTETGNKFITGGDYGVEGGISCTIALLLSTALIYFLPVFKASDEMLALTSRETGEKSEL